MLSFYAEMEPGDWRTEGEINYPRTLLARLELGKDIDGVNAALSELSPWGTTGSSFRLPGGFLQRRGDYNFTLVTLTAILYLYGHDEEKLYPETLSRVLDKLLVLDGAGPALRVPGTPFARRKTIYL